MSKLPVTHIAKAYIMARNLSINLCMQRQYIAILQLHAMACLSTRFNGDIEMEVLPQAYECHQKSEDWQAHIQEKCQGRDHNCPRLAACFRVIVLSWLFLTLHNPKSFQSSKYSQCDSSGHVLMSKSVFHEAAQAFIVDTHKSVCAGGKY